MDLDDILLWSDGFWCLRRDTDQQLLRNKYFRVISFATDEWQELLTTSRSSSPPTLAAPLAGIEPGREPGASVG
jgi:hypothetical protein